MLRTNNWHIELVAVAMIIGISFPAWAVPYASGVRTVAGNTKEFVLNEAADNVTVLRDGANPVTFAGPAAGRYQFDMTGFTNYSIEVSKDAPAEWTLISGDGSNLFTRFEQPAGVAVNSNPASPYFGTVYVVNSRNLQTAAAGGGEIPARAMGEGVYALTSDLIGVELNNSFNVVADPQDTSQAKAPNWVMDTSTTAISGRNSPWRMQFDNAGNMIVADWSVNTGGLKWISADLTQGGALLAQENGGSLFGVENGMGQAFHSSIASRPHVTGTLGIDLEVTAIDTYLEAIQGSTEVDGQNIWRWNIGSHDPATLGGFDGVPQLVINGTSLGGDGVWFVGVQGVTADMFYSPQHDLYYLTQPRSNGTEPSLLIVDANLATDPTGNTPIVKFDSLAFTRANGLDGRVDTPIAIPSNYDELDGDDIFRMAGNAEVSQDGKWLFLHRSQSLGTVGGDSNGENVVLGRSSNNPGEVLVIPLDNDGLPIISIDEMGTPEKIDDRITNFQSLPVIAPGGTPRAYAMDIDAAGNVYITHNGSELLRVLSPGGSTKAITNSDGTFSVTSLTNVPGDYNSNGIVDAADYTIWRDNLNSGFQLQNEGDITPGLVTQEDYDFWKSRFGATTAGSGGAAGAVASVPEPGSLCMVVAGLVFIFHFGVRCRMQLG